MNEWLLSGCFLVLAILAFIIATYPVRKMGTKGLLLLSSIFIIFVIMAYRQWGAWPALQAYAYEQTKREEAKKLLATIKSPNELAEKLKAKLDNTPASARGWYLLGRVYASQKQWFLARDAFAKSHQLNPADEPASVNYAESLWQLNKQQTNEQIRALFQQLLTNNPYQPDALAMLAMDAYERHDYHQAEQYWQHLLTLAPPQSKEAKALRKAIVKAQEQAAIVRSIK
jgi:cytochrome c-type biogenesis protein CcmH